MIRELIIRKNGIVVYETKSRPEALCCGSIFIHDVCSDKEIEKKFENAHKSEIEVRFVIDMDVKTNMVECGFELLNEDDDGRLVIATIENEKIVKNIERYVKEWFEWLW